MRLGITKILCLIFIFELIGCQGLTDYKITGLYYLVAVDGDDNMTLSYSVNQDNSSFVGIIDPCVFAVGYNDKYIIIKQHPVTNHKIEKKVINFYIVPIYKKFTRFPERGIIGPLTLEQFNEQRKKLNIADSLAFTKVIKKLE